MPAPEFEENCLEISKQAMPNPDKKEELSDLLEKPIIDYIKVLLKQVYREATNEEAENLLGNIGFRRYLKNNYAQPRTK